MTSTLRTESHTGENIPITQEAFLEGDFDGYEYVKGELVPMPPGSMEHGEISVNVIGILGMYVYENRLGRMYIAATTFKLTDRIVKPDVAFLSNERLPEDRKKGSPIPPDLAVEVVSPTDRHYALTEKVLAYIRAGTRLVWVLEPVGKTVTVYRSETDITVLTCADTLTGEPVLPGFACSVERLFE